MSLVNALKTIKLYNRRFTRQQCIDLGDKYIKLIKAKYPSGIPESQYFVVPGFNNITKNQPVIIYGIDGEYQLSTVNKF